MRMFLTCGLTQDLRGRWIPRLKTDPAASYTALQVVSDIPNNTSWCLLIVDTDAPETMAAVETVSVCESPTTETLNDIGRRQLANPGFDASIYL